MMMGLNEISAFDAINNLSETNLKLVIKILEMKRKPLELLRIL